MVRIGRLPAADQTGLRGNELKVCLVADTLGLGDGKLAFVMRSGLKSSGAGANGGASKSEPAVRVGTGARTSSIA